jgi:hypothetical protein
MPRRTPFALFILCAGALALQSAAAQEQYTLTYRLAKDHAYRFADTMTVKSSQEMMGQEMKTSSTIFTRTKLVPSEVKADGSTVLTVSAEAMSMTVKNARMDTTMIPTEMIGKRTLLTISKLGETLKREVIDTVKQGGMGATTGRQDMVRLHLMPAKAVKIGDTWQSTKPDTMPMPSGGQMITVATGDFTLLAKEPKMGLECLKISYTGKVTITGKWSQNGMDFFIEGSGTTGGTYFVDASTGLPVVEDSKTDVESTVAITGAQSMTVPGSQSAVTHRMLLRD